jgi:hypothetical protein
MENGVFWDVTPCGSCKSQQIRVTRIGELGTKLAATSNRFGTSSERAPVASYG